MKPHILFLHGLVSFGLGLGVPLLGQPCAPGATLKPISLQVRSQAGVATLVGFNEFAHPSSPPKKFLRHETSGTIYSGSWGNFDCVMPQPVLSYSGGGVVGTLPGYPFVPISWLATLSPVAVGADGKVLLRAGATGADDNGTPLTVQILLAGPIPGSADDIVFSNQSEKVVDAKGGPYTVLPFTQSVGFLYFFPSGGEILQPPVSQARDEWSAVREFSVDDPSGPLAIDQNSSQRYQGSAYGYPMVTGGTAAGPPTLSRYAGFVTESLSPTVRQLTGSGACVGTSFGSAKFTGQYLETLSKEDEEDDAEDRAVLVPGTDPTAYRTRRTTGFSFAFSWVNYSARFVVCSPGDYNLYVSYSEKTRGGTGSTGATRRRFLRMQRLEPGEQVVTGLIRVPEAPFDRFDVDYTIVGVEAEAICHDGPPGSSGSEFGSAYFWMNLGRSQADKSAGQLRLETDVLTPEIYTPRALVLTADANAGVEVIRTMDQAVRQVRTPQGLADVLVINPTAFTVRFYASAQLGSLNAATGVYEVSGTPYAVYRFENPDPPTAPLTRLRVTEESGALNRVTEFAHDPVTGVWTHSRGNGLRRESQVTAVIGGELVKTVTVSNAADEVASKVARTYRTFAWGQELIKEVLDPDGAALTTSYEFYDTTPADPNYRQLRQRIDARGGWERYAYDLHGRLLKTIRPFLAAPPTTVDETLCRVTQYAYDTIADADGDGVPDNRTTIVERVLGQEVGRRYRIEWSALAGLGEGMFKRRSDIVAVTSGAAWNAATNLVTETLTYPTGDFAGRERRVTNPDGTVTLQDYGLETDGTLVATVATGQPSSPRDAVVDGERVVTRTNSAGEVVAEAVSDLASGLSLTSWTATQFDSLARPTRLEYSDGTFETRSYACCGLESSRDRSGRVTSYLYDDLGRTVAVKRDGLTTVTSYDADGRVLSVVRVGIDGSGMVQETSRYDLAGRLLERRDALDRPTRFIESTDAVSGHVVRTTIHPDGGTAVDVAARDGSTLARSGTAVPPRAFEYGVELDGFFAKEIAVGEDATGAPTFAEWTKRYLDLAGRTHKVLHADGAVVLSYFNAAGQVVREVDPDGVTTLFAYNARGERDAVAIDLNGNGVIDFAGADRILRTKSSVGQKTAGNGVFIVRRTVTESWETDGADLPTIVAEGEQSSDGLRTWETVRGLTTQAVIAVDGSGSRTVTTTGPDGVVTIETFAGEKLLSSTVRAADGLPLASTTNTYDSHQRLATSTDARNGPTTFTYYADDQVHTITTPDPDLSVTGSGYDPQTTTLEYDSAGRVARVTHPDGAVVSTTHWPTGLTRRVSGARTYPAEYSYDPQGRMKTLTTWRDFAGDSDRAITTWNYSPSRGLLQTKRYADGTGPEYAYKPSGRMLSRRWARTPAVTTTYSYNPAGEVSAIDYSDATPDVVVTYDRAGRLKTLTDGSGSRTLAYDAAGLPAGETYSAGPLSGLGLNRHFDTLHRLDQMVPSLPSLASVTFAYDTASRLRTIIAGLNSVSYQYESDSPLVKATSFQNGGAARLATVRTYDRLNRLTSISNQSTSGGVASYAYTYDGANQRTRVAREDQTSWNYGYDVLGQVTTGTKLLGNGTPALGHAFAYAYDDIGNRRTTTNNGRTSGYVANALNQYVERTVPGVIHVAGAAAPDTTVTVSINGGPPLATTRQAEGFYRQIDLANGSAQAHELTVTGVKNLAGPNGEDVVTEVSRPAFVAGGTQSFVHDADGNLTQDARWIYSWDAENRLTRVETSDVAATAGAARQRLEFVYDTQHRRVAKSVSNWDGSMWVVANSTLFLYDGWNLLAELNELDGNAPIRSYVWGLDLSGAMQGAGGVGGLLSITDHLSPTPTTHFAAYDGNGNVAGLVSAQDGSRTATYDYDPFGQSVRSEGAMADKNPFRFSTKFSDPETGHFYYGYRSYAPVTGRWLSRDPSGEFDSMNRYVAASNNLASSIDVLGLYQEDGHFYTAYSIARANGRSRRDAYEIAYYTQYPDEDSTFDALPAWWRLRMTQRGDREYDLATQRVLHSLHGGDANDVRRWRECLIQKLQTGGRLQAWQQGLITHALGDAFSHTRNDGSAYQPPEGHGHRGHGPDIPQTRPALFQQYVLALNRAFGGNATNRELGEIIFGINQYPPGGPRRSDRMRQSRDFVQRRWGYRENYDPAPGRRIDPGMARLSRKQVHDFLRELWDQCGCEIRNGSLFE